MKIDFPRRLCDKLSKVNMFVLILIVNSIETIIIKSVGLIKDKYGYYPLSGAYCSSRVWFQTCLPPDETKNRVEA